MAHYDYLYEEFTMSETEAEFKRSHRLLTRLTEQKEALFTDLNNVISTHTVNLLKGEIQELELRIKKLQNKLKGWEVVKIRIETGEKTTYQMAHDIVSRGF